MNRILEMILIIIGSVFVALGVIGIFLPLLPTTPFLLVGASCYIRGSQKLYNLLINNKHLGEYIKNYREGRGIPRKTKLIALLMLWSSIGFSILFVLDNVYVKALIFLIAVGVSWHIVSLKNFEHAEQEIDSEQEPLKEEKSL